MNIYINNYCNQRCPYCFAADYMNAREKKDMSFGDFKMIINFLKKSKYPLLRLEGGEPTLHPRFKDFVDYAIEHKFRINLFTNASFGQDIRNYLYERREYIGYLFNINHPSFYSREAWLRLKRNLMKLVYASPSALGMNIYRTDQDLNYMYDLCKIFKPDIFRFVFAHQIGRCSKVETIQQSDLYKVIPKLIEIIKRIGDELGIKMGFDCGFVPCVWTDAQLGILTRYGVRLGECNICPVVDPDLNVGHCFHRICPKSKSHITNFKDLNEIYSCLEKYKDKYNNLYLFKECKKCISRELNACDGGCLGDRKAIKKP